jgi:hypothetical protein
LSHPAGERTSVQATAHLISSIFLPWKNHTPVFDGGDQLHFRVGVAVDTNLPVSGGERFNLFALDVLQTSVEVLPDLSHRRTPIGSNARFGGDTLLGNHAEAEADQHGGWQDEGEEEENDLSPVWVRSHRSLKRNTL